jgi:hypothetical protein
MNTRTLITTISCITALNACSCNGQPASTSSIGDTTRPAVTIRNLIAVDSIPVASLSPFLQEALRLRYAGDPSIINLRVIPNPFPRADSLTAFRELRCNVSPTRIFTAQRTQISINYTLNRPDILWKGVLLNTGVTSDRVDFNIMTLSAKPDSTVLGGYRFFYGELRISNTEAYEIDTFDPYFVFIHYNPSRLPLAVCRGTQPPTTTTR